MKTVYVHVSQLELEKCLDQQYTPSIYTCIEIHNDLEILIIAIYIT